MDERSESTVASTQSRESVPDWTEAVQLTTGEVVRHRLLAVLVLRSLGIIGASLALLPIAAWIAEGLWDGDLLDMSYYIGHLVLALVFLSLGGAMILLAPRIARWWVPVGARPLCPSCSFDLTGLGEPRCPECGLAITGRSASADRPMYSRTWLLGMVLVLRAFAVLMLCMRVTFRLLELDWYGADNFFFMVFYPLMGWSEFLRFVGGLVSMIAPSLALWWLAPPLARASMRIRQRPHPESTAEREPLSEWAS